MAIRLDVKVAEHLRIDPNTQMPVGVQIRQQLTLLITGGTLRPGDRLPPVRNLGPALGVNYHTIRAAYQHLEEDGLVDMRQGRGTTVIAFEPERLLARASVTRTFTVGIIIPSYNPFYSPLLEAIEDAAADDALLFVIGNARDDIQRGLTQLDRIMARGVDGMIVTSPVLPLHLARSRAKAYPNMVFLDWPGGPQPQVLFDLHGGAATATQHLIEHGHRRIGLLCPPTSWPNIAPRHAGYLHALSTAGIEPAPDLIAVTADFTHQSAHRATQALIQQPDPPTAIFAATDPLAATAINTIQHQGIRVPDNVAIIGFDNAPYTTTGPELTTIDLPTHQMGTQAMTMLRNLINGTQPQRTQTLPTSLIIRQSCGCNP